mgnify:CR=1 FL=1
MSSQFADSSRPSKTNVADRENDAYGPSTADTLRTPLTERDGVTLREEVRDFGALDERATSTRGGVWRWRDYIEEKRGVSAVFENSKGDRVTGGDPHRFAPEYADKQYAKLKDLERGVRDDYGKRLHTAMLSFTCSTTDDSGEPRPPVDHLLELDESRYAVDRALDRALEGRRWERLAILEPHKSGHLHLHMAVFVDGPVTRETFAPVIEAHLRNCPGAGEEAHRLHHPDPKKRVVSVNHVGGDRAENTIENLGTYLAEYLGTYGEDPLEASEYVQIANTVLWATQKRRWRPSRGAQKYMATNRTDDLLSDWELVAIRDGDGEEYEVSERSGGVATFTTGTDPPDPPPS